MDGHAEDEESKDCPVSRDDLKRVNCPRGADLMDHVLGNIPCCLVGNGRIEVRARSEEQTGEGDEREGHQDIPRALHAIGKGREALMILLREVELPQGLDDHTDKYERIGNEQDIPEW